MKESTVLLMCPLYPPTQRRLEETYQVHRLWEAKEPEALIAKLAPQLQVVVTSGGRGIDAATLAKLPGVKLVSCFGVGVDGAQRGSSSIAFTSIRPTPATCTNLC